MSIEKKGTVSGHTDMIIFFAEVSDKLQGYKDNLIQELKNNGCIIKQASLASDDIDQLRQTIEQCDAAIHILSDQDFKQDSSDKGREEIQVNCSVQHYLSQKLLSDSSESDFKIYAWHQKASSESIFQEEKVAPHLRKIQQHEEVDFLRTNFEEFKYYLLKRIENIATEELDEFYIKGNDSISIYFLHDAVDKEAASEYIDYLNVRGYTVFSSVFGGDIMTLRQTHTNYLKKFDIALIFGKEAGANWINMKILDILKSPGLGREKSILGKAICIPDHKRNLLAMTSRGFEIIDIENDVVKRQLDGFLQKVNA